MTSQTPAPYANKFTAMKSFWLFLWAKQYREKFLKLSQPKELRERSKDQSEVAWQPEEWITAKENRQVLVEAGWFGMWRPFRAWQFRSDQRRICERSLIFKLETVKLLCLQQFFSSDTMAMSSEHRTYLHVVSGRVYLRRFQIPFVFSLLVSEACCNSSSVYSGSKL